MRPFELLRREHVEPAAKEMLQNIESGMGFLPNLASIVAVSTPALEAFTTLNKALGESSLSPMEKETVEITTSIENRCGYCTAAHSRFAYSVDMTKEQVEALRAGSPLDDSRLEALRIFTRDLVRSKGHVSQESLVYFYEAGFSSRHVIDVILGITVKTFTNFVSNSVKVPLDTAFQEFAWSEDELAPA